MNGENTAKDEPDGGYMVYQIDDIPEDGVCAICDRPLTHPSYGVKMSMGIYEIVCKNCVDFSVGYP